MQQPSQEREFRFVGGNGNLMLTGASVDEGGEILTLTGADAKWIFVITGSAGVAKSFATHVNGRIHLINASYKSDQDMGEEVEGGGEGEGDEEGEVNEATVAATSSNFLNFKLVLNATL